MTGGLLEAFQVRVTNWQWDALCSSTTRKRVHHLVHPMAEHCGIQGDLGIKGTSGPWYP